jgi:hypothetical protein
MKHHYRAKWVSYKERNLWCCDFSNFNGDQKALAEEIKVSGAVIHQQKTDSMLVAVYMHKAEITPELLAFLKKASLQSDNPIHKMAIIGVTGLEKLWYEWVKKVRWPANARFFTDYEKAKAWLVAETF